MEVSERNVDPELTEGSAELTPLCEPCRADGKELEAHGFCNNCNEYMCPSCIKVHGKLTATKHHNVLGKQKMPTHYPARKKAPDVSCLELCKDHPPEAIKFFCPTHAQLCCGDCIVLDHRACKIDYIPRVAPSFTESSEFKAIVEKVETLEVACTNSERNLEAHEQSVLELNIIEIKKIQAFRVEINEYLNKQEKALIKFMGDAKKKDTDCIRRWREDINAAKLTLAETKSRLKDQNTASNIYIAARHAENLLNDIQTMIMKAKTENLLTGYKFCRDKKTEELLSWNDTLGRVDQSKVRYLSTYESSVFKKPQRLIITKKNNILEVCDDVLDEISRIDKPCVIVAIAGLYRTGKSYLMNLLANSQTGFAIGDSIESKTKGIWVWCRDHPEQKNTVLMLLDTEGLGDVDNGDSNHDNHIFTLATLLCSTLVYNMKGAFDQDAVNKLTFVSEVSRNIKFGGRCGEGNSLLQCVLPGFVLALRDFSLRLIKGGRQITSDEYLEEYLETNTRKDVSFNKPRECIRKFFPQDKRRCFAFPIPGNIETLEKLESLTFEELSPRFKTVTTMFVSYIYSQEPKQLQVSKPINGPMFVTLTRNYVDAFASGSVPDVDDTFAMVAKIENQRVKNECMNMFHSKMKELLLPLPSKLLDKHFTDARWSALEYMRTNTIKDIANAVERDAQMEMDLFQQQCQRANEEKIEELCRNILDGMESLCKLKAGSENKEYEVLGGHRIFKRDVDKMRKEYEQALLGYEQREIRLVWRRFASDLSLVENQILDKDNKLSKKEKRREKEENEYAMEKMIVEMAQDSQKALERQQKEMDEQNLKLNAERERRNKEYENKFTGLLNRIAALEKNKEDHQK